MLPRSSYAISQRNIKGKYMSKYSKRKTALIVGRWQPWHDGHRELFKSALSKAERVAIGVRHSHATDGKNPFTFN